MFTPFLVEWARLVLAWLPSVKPGLVLLIPLLLAFFAPQVLAEEPLGIPAMTLTTAADGTQQYTVTLQILFLMTALTLLPALMMMMTSFTRIIIVFSILRQALGLQQTPSNQILLGMALFLTFFIMSPVFNQANETALQPYMNGEMAPMQALETASKPGSTGIGVVAFSQAWFSPVNPPLVGFLCPADFG